MGNAADKAGVARKHVSPDTHAKPRATTTPNAFPVAVGCIRPYDSNLADGIARRKQSNNHGEIFHQSNLVGSPYQHWRFIIWW
jgi:hypothetical protein